GDFGFAAKPRQRLEGKALAAGVQHLERDQFAGQPAVARGPDFTHAAAPDDAHQLVGVADEQPRVERSARRRGYGECFGHPTAATIVRPCFGSHAWWRCCSRGLRRRRWINRRNSTASPTTGRTCGCSPTARSITGSTT